MIDDSDLHDTLRRIATDHGADDLPLVLDTDATSAYITESRGIVVNPDGYDQSDALSEAERRSLLYESVAHLAMLSTETPLDAKGDFISACLEKYNHEPTLVPIDGDETPEPSEGPNIINIAGVVFNTVEEARTRYAMTHRYRDRRETILSMVSHAMANRPDVDGDDREQALLEGFISLAMTGSVRDGVSVDADLRAALAKVHPLVERARKMDNPADRLTLAHTMMDILVRTLDGEPLRGNNALPRQTLEEWYGSPEPDGFVTSPLVDS